MIINYTPDNITLLKPNEIILVGTNPEGRHGKGLALVCKEKFGLTLGKSLGLIGQCYGIITKELRKDHKQITLLDIDKQVFVFIEFTKQHPELTFYVTKIGCGLAGFDYRNIALMFKNCLELPNVILPLDFVLHLTSIK